MFISCPSFIPQPAQKINWKKGPKKNIKYSYFLYYCSVCYTTEVLPLKKEDIAIKIPYQFTVLFD